MTRLRLLVRQVASAFSRTLALSYGLLTSAASASSPSFAKPGHTARTGPWHQSSTAQSGAGLVGFVHPASGWTVFHLASTVSIALFEVELAAFAQQVGASPHKQIVLVLDRTGWHSSLRLRVPEHVHLLFLPLYSPELQPAEYLWPLTSIVLANRHFATLDELEGAQAKRCVALNALSTPIRSTMLFPWWPRRITKRQGPRRG